MTDLLTPVERLDALVDLFKRYRFTYTDEYGLQGSLFDVLTEAGYKPTREKFLPRIGRLDLAVGRIAIEVKIHGQVPNVIRQVGRYCKSREIDGVVLVTTVARHAQVPAVINGKPVRTALLLGTLQ